MGDDLLGIHRIACFAGRECAVAATFNVWGSSSIRKIFKVRLMIVVALVFG